ncbi:prolipoprotein diacylglyceryl transferase [Zavarzinia sp. CC-PAN008]|uniref:prolipoprotein diacylglyceryl transferase n=1 Tax=Zavarzinia sp. CC-PAN008 TaxID=3243332 RepID=UPI003F745048
MGFSLFVIPYPMIDPVALEVGPVVLRWYALAYIVGLIAAWRLMVRLARQPGSPVPEKDADDFLIWATLGVILGGRLGYILFYNFNQYLADPLSILLIWHGGMSFHGGMLGVVIAMIVFARRRGIPLFALSDMVSLGVPIGLFFGRIANFINGELWGRPTDVAWAMVFPRDPAQVPRHPSQLYEAVLEGLVLLAVVWLVNLRFDARRRPGLVTGTFLIGYGTARIICEFFREPDVQLGFLAFGTTMGQILSVPMILFGIWMVRHALVQPPLPQPVASRPAA